ncbi:hypothetical protein SK128_022894 [Halocaridina rubra]|uniref:Uncharacterized protein n=1 Tax=Halocaridina rubra TaxID=373956 RepID=A0AAN8W8N4_HALRR
MNKAKSNSREVELDIEEVKQITTENRVKTREVGKRIKKSDSLKVKRGLYNIHPVKSLDSLLFSDATLAKSSISTDGTRRGSYTEGVTNNRKEHYVNLTEGNFASSLKVDNGEIIPKRKKSLTWSEDTQTIQCSNKELSSSRKSGINDHCDRCLRDNHRKSSISSRRNSHTTGSERIKGSRNNEYGEVAVTRGGSLGPGGRRRSSTVSSCSNRKGSEQWQTIPVPYKKERSLSASSGSSARRNSRRNTLMRDEEEAESLLGRSAGGQTDVTLASILNHIAYVNQTASASKWPMELKDSRKAQVQQVLIVTYVTAALGTVLSLALVYRLYGHFISGVAVLPNPPWLWFTYESGCRFLEFLMGCAMANITRQPVPNRHPQYPHSLRRLKHRNSLYI